MPFGHALPVVQMAVAVPGRACEQIPIVTLIWECPKRSCTIFGRMIVRQNPPVSHAQGLDPC